MTTRRERKKTGFQSLLAIFCGGREDCWGDYIGTGAGKPLGIAEWVRGNCVLRTILSHVMAGMSHCITAPLWSVKGHCLLRWDGWAQGQDLGYSKDIRWRRLLGSTNANTE